MIDDIYEQSTFIIDLSQAVLDHSGGLKKDQVEHLEAIHRRAVEFITEFLQKQSEEIEVFRSYLNHDALSPITIIVGYADMLLMDTQLADPYREAFQQIRDSGNTLRDLVQEMLDFVMQLV